MAIVTTKKLVTKTLKIIPSVSTDGVTPVKLTRTFIDTVFVPVGGTIYDTVSVSINGQEISANKYPGQEFLNNRFYYTIVNSNASVVFEIFSNRKLTEYPYTIELVAQNPGAEATYQPHYGRLNTDPTVVQPTSVANFFSPSLAWFNEQDIISLQYQYEVIETIVVV